MVGLRERWRLVRAAADRHAVARAVEPDRVVTFSAQIHDSLLSAVAGRQFGTVNRDVALQVPAVLRGRNLICAIATLPLVTVDAVRSRVETGLLRQIDPQTANVVTLAMTVEDLLMDAVAWWRVTAREPAPVGVLGFPSNAEHVSSQRVSLNPPPGVDVRALPSGLDPDSAVWVDGLPVDGATMIRFDSPNPPLLTAARRAIRRAAKLEMAAELYAESPRAQDYFTPSDGADPAEDDDIAAILDEWKAARQARSTAYVPASLKYETVQAWTPAEMQLADLQKRAALDIANALGLDPEDLGISTTSRTYQNNTDRRKDRINDVLAPYMLAVTSRLSMDDVTRRGQAVSFDLADYLKPDPITRVAYYKGMNDLDALTSEEVREAEGLAPRPVGAVAGQSTSGAAAAAASDGKVTSMRHDRPLRAAFAAEPPPGRVTFAVPAAQAAFSVDIEARTITGMAVPYGEVTSDWRQIQFGTGSVEVPNPVKKVKCMYNHYGSLLGVASSVTDGTDGLTASLKIARTSDGDDALVLADDGALDGLSVGVDIHEYSLNEDDGVMTVLRATLREISLTPFPAFDSARVQDVRLNSNTNPPKGNPAMLPQNEPAPAPAPITATVADPAPVAPPAAVPVSVNLSLGEDFAGQLAAALVAAAPEVPAVISPRAGARAATLAVSEPLPYRFDGRRNEHDFSSDLFAMARRSDPDAQVRIEKFMRQAFADVSTGDVNELNPTRNRPDLFVDNLDFTTPIWDAIVKGSIPDATPFTVPQFSSAATLVSDHSESTEPTGGTYVTTGMTVTPTALSGKVEITRETIDQGGNPQVSQLIWGEIVRAYNESLEVKAVDMLDALTPTGIVLNGVDSDLDADITANLAALAFVRGGNRFQDFFIDSALFGAIVGATDDNGRKLYPILAPANASGTTSGNFGDVLIGSLRARPAWALEVANGGSASSYLFNRSDCHGWATPPQQLRFEYEVKSIWLGVWGYVATANTRLAGVREITYSAV